MVEYGGCSASNLLGLWGHTDGGANLFQERYWRNVF
jgi:hypothetical protein